jgi:hypothetical protein
VWGGLRLVAWTVVEVLGLDRSGQHTAQGTLGLSALAFSQTFDNNTFIDDFPSCIVDFIFLDYSHPESVAHRAIHCLWLTVALTEQSAHAVGGTPRAQIA